MENTKKHFFLKLNPPRTDFMQTMTEEERSAMQQHVAYWKQYVDNGTMLILGPVFDPKGGYGIGIVEVDDEQILSELQKNDPALKIGNTYETYPMRAVRKI